MFWRKDINKIKAKYERELMKKCHLEAIAVGHKIKGGRDTGEEAIVCFVQHKIFPSMMDKEEVVPEKLEGIKTDVVEIGGEIRPMEYRRKHRPVIGGISGKAENGTACSIGLICFKDGKPGILSNDHCAHYPSGKNNQGKKFLQPSPMDSLKNYKCKDCEYEWK